MFGFAASIQFTLNLFWWQPKVDQVHQTVTPVGEAVHVNFSPQVCRIKKGSNPLASQCMFSAQVLR